MGSSLYNSMGRQTQNPIGGQFQQFMGQMQGKNPQEMINQMLTSGQLSQQQLNAMQQGFNGTNIALMQGQNALATQLADCCCKTQTAIQGVNYNLATQECDTRNQMQQGFCATQNAMNNNTRDIIENQNSNTRAVLDFLTNDKIATLQSENNELRRAASQDRQSAFLTTAMNAQTNQIIGTLQQKAPVPAYQVPNPNAIYYGCGTGCGSCA